LHAGWATWCWTARLFAQMPTGEILHIAGRSETRASRPLRPATVCRTGASAAKFSPIKLP
jgi:hypothetical protein